MKIIDIETTDVQVPGKHPLGQALGSQLGAKRLIMQILTDEGVVGLGETSAPKIFMDEVVKPILVGLDPFNIEYIEAKINERLSWVCPNQESRQFILGPVEIALWDMIGKAVGKPICDLIGGSYRNEVEFNGYVFPSRTGDRMETADEVAKFSRDLIRRYGFGLIELKTGIQPPKVEIEIVRVLREEVGPDIDIRIDSNAAWSPVTAIRTLNAMKKYDLENVEDPTPAPAMARVSEMVGMPFSTHRYSIEGVIEVANSGSADSVVPDDDIGFLELKKVVGVAQACGLGCWLHTSNVLGISVAAKLHFLASTPYIVEPSQIQLEYLTDDVVKGGMVEIKNGCVCVPRGPGLGVEIDEKKVERYHELFKAEAEQHKRPNLYNITSGGVYPDGHRPEWFPERRWGSIFRMT